MDYKFVYRDKNGFFWAVTDYGPHRLGKRGRRAAQRRATLLLVATAGLVLAVMVAALIWR